MDQQPQQPPEAQIQQTNQPQGMPNEQAAPLPPNKSKKRVIIASVISLVVIALIAFLVWFFALRVTISTEDYKQASTDSVALQTAYEKVYKLTDEKLPDMIVAYNSKTDDPDVKEIKNLFQDYNEKSDAFLKLQALKDQDIKSNQKEFFEKNEQFNVFMNGFFDSVASLKDTDLCAKAKMINYTHKTALIVFDKAYEQCFAALDGVVSSKNVAISKYGTAVKKTFNELRDLHEDIQTAALAGNTVAQQEASNKILAVNPDTYLQDAGEEVFNDIESVDISDQLKALQGALKNKAQ